MHLHCWTTCAELALRAAIPPAPPADRFDELQVIRTIGSSEYPVTRWIPTCCSARFAADVCVCWLSNPACSARCAPPSGCVYHLTQVPRVSSTSEQGDLGTLFASELAVNSWLSVEIPAEDGQVRVGYVALWQAAQFDGYPFGSGTDYISPFEVRACSRAWCASACPWLAVSRQCAASTTASRAVFIRASVPFQKGVAWWTAWPAKRTLRWATRSDPRAARHRAIHGQLRRGGHRLCAQHYEYVNPHAFNIVHAHAHAAQPYPTAQLCPHPKVPRLYLGIMRMEGCVVARHMSCDRACASARPSHSPHTWRRPSLRRAGQEALHYDCQEQLQPCIAASERDQNLPRPAVAATASNAHTLATATTAAVASVATAAVAATTKARVTARSATATPRATVHAIHIWPGIWHPPWRGDACAARSRTCHGRALLGPAARAAGQTAVWLLARAERHAHAASGPRACER